LSPINRFRQKLHSGYVCLGAGITLSDPLVTEALADSVDFFWIDLEHSAMSAQTLGLHLLAARARDVPALVRVPASNTPFIKPVLDVGAEGIIVPQVRSVDEVRQVVADCRYAPAGRRGYGPRVPSNYGRDGGQAYIERASREVFVSVQIETVEALEALDDILAVGGLDSLVIGPWDLSGALGVLGQVEHPRVVAAIDRIIAKTRDAGIFIGAGMGNDAGYAQRMAQRGIQWLQVGSDFGYLVECMDQITSSVRCRLGDSPPPAEKRGQ
jgi:2-keto-3-deoxy-L-rhamnonate aldolase RhmA